MGKYRQNPIQPYVLHRHTTKIDDFKANWNSVKSADFHQNSWPNLPQCQQFFFLENAKKYRISDRSREVNNYPFQLRPKYDIKHVRMYHCINMVYHCITTFHCITDLRYIKIEIFQFFRQVQWYFWYSYNHHKIL